MDPYGSVHSFSQPRNLSIDDPFLSSLPTPRLFNHADLTSFGADLENPFDAYSDFPSESFSSGYNVQPSLPVVPRGTMNLPPDYNFNPAASQSGTDLAHSTSNSMNDDINYSAQPSSSSTDLLSTIFDAIPVNSTPSSSYYSDPNVLLQPGLNLSMSSDSVSGASRPGQTSVAPSWTEPVFTQPAIPSKEHQQQYLAIPPVSTPFICSMCPQSFACSAQLM